MLHSNRNTIMMGKTCCVVAVSVGLILLLSGRCLGALPKVDFTKFVPDDECVVDQVTIVNSTFTLDLTGVDKSKYLDSVSISDAIMDELARTKFSICPSVEDLKMMCIKQDGDVYTLQYSFKAGREFSGLLYWASILETDFATNVTSAYSHQYPFVKYAPVQNLTIRSDDSDFEELSMKWHYQTDPKFEVGNRPDKFNLTYHVEGLTFVTHSISILDKDMNVVSTSNTDYTITATLPGNTERFYVRYTSDYCETTSQVDLNDPPPTTTTSTTTPAPSPVETTETEATTTEGDNDGPNPAGPGEDWWIYLVVVLVVIVVAAAIIIAVVVYKRRPRKPLTVEIGKDSSLKDLEKKVRPLLSGGATIEALEFYHTDKDTTEVSKKDNTETKIKDLMPKAERDGGEEVVVEMLVKADKKTVNIIIKDIQKKQYAGKKDVETGPAETPGKPKLSLTESELIYGTAV